MRICPSANLMIFLVLGLAGPNVAELVLKELTNHQPGQEVEFAKTNSKTKTNVRGKCPIQKIALFLNVQIKVNISFLYSLHNGSIMCGRYDY